MAITEKFSFQVPVPAGKHLVGSDTETVVIPLGASVSDLRAVDLIAFAQRELVARFGGTPHHVLAVEMRPDRPTDVLARVLLPRFA
jgi:hypothetical protein